jgi:hypothetical protein
MAAPVASPRLETQRVTFGAWFGVVLLFTFFGLLVAVLIGASPRGNDYEAKRAKAREEKLKTARDDATRELNSYAWVDKSKGLARIPIDYAMQLTLAELAQKKPEPANPIESPSPAAAPQSAATQTGAAQPSATPSAPPQASVTPKPSSVAGVNAEIRGQPAGAANPPNAQPGSQPGPSATPAAAPSPPTEQPAVSPSVTPSQNPPGTPIPIAGKTPPP